MEAARDARIRPAKRYGVMAPWLASVIGFLVLPTTLWGRGDELTLDYFVYATSFALVFSLAAAVWAIPAGARAHRVGFGCEARRARATPSVT